MREVDWRVAPTLYRSVINSWPSPFSSTDSEKPETPEPDPKPEPEPDPEPENPEAGQELPETGEIEGGEPPAKKRRGLGRRKAKE